MQAARAITPVAMLLLPFVLIATTAAAPLSFKPAQAAAESLHSSAPAAGELISSFRSPVSIASGSLPHHDKTIEVFNQAEHWLVHPKDVPALTRSRSSRSSLLDGVREKLRTPLAKVKITKDGNVQMVNTASSPRLFRFGSADKTYYVLPRTRETIPAKDLTETQFRALTIHKLPTDTGVVYNEVAL